MRKNVVTLLTFLFVAGPLTTSCGSSGNAFEKAYSKSKKEEAELEIRKENWDSAISLLRSYLQEKPNDGDAKSMLFFAISKKGLGGKKFDPVTIISQFSNPNNTGSDFQKLAQSMPAGTQENVDQLKDAVAMLNSIPESERSPAQNYQLAVANATLAVTQAKMVATDESGNFDKEKADQMSEEQATVIVESMNGADKSLSASGSNDEQAGKLGGITGGLNQSEGSSNKEKLSNYLQKK